jgi:thiamine monophosphate synthase
VPLVAIGGITRERAASVAAHAELVAVIGALLPASGLEGVAASTQALVAALRR